MHRVELLTRDCTNECRCHDSGEDKLFGLSRLKTDLSVHKEKRNELSVRSLVV